MNLRFDARPGTSSPASSPPKEAGEKPSAPAAPLTIELRNRQRARRIDARRLRSIVKALLRHVGVTAGELGVVFVDAREMTRINETFLRHEGSTDVITFDYGQPGPQSIPAPARLAAPVFHGELFVCVDAAIQQARQFHVRWQSELVRYIAHGVLHLQGFDDQSASPRRRMKREEDRLLRTLAGAFELEKLDRDHSPRPSSPAT